MAISLSLKLFGLNEFVVKIPSIIFSLIVIYLTYLIASLLFDNKTGLLAAFFHSINGYLIELVGGRVSSDHVETAFLLFTELSIYLVAFYIVKKRNIYLPIFIGITTGLAVLSKWSPALLVFPVWIIGAYFSIKVPVAKLMTDNIIAFFALVIMVLPYQIFTLLNYPEEASWVIKKFLFAYSSIVEGHAAPWYYYINQVGIIFGEIIFIPLLVSLIHLIKKQSDWKIIYLSSWWIIPLVVFSFAETKRSTYLLIAAPAFFIILSHYWFYFYEKRSSFKRKWVINLLLILLILLPIRYSIERVKPFMVWDRTPKWTMDLKELDNKFGEHGNVVIFNLEHDIEAMFYTDYTVYKMLPKTYQLKKLEKRGFRIIINDDGTIPDEIKGLKSIEFIPLSIANSQ